ncbi:hypothetical protein [Arenimonas sp. MALMAid1274]|uniref:hypothetical protein n=1 Tax=Arenimonas sp. MALMAid1274 TaxID=3411630 RepID=UPI003BA2E737
MNSTKKRAGLVIALAALAAIGWHALRPGAAPSATVESVQAAASDEQVPADTVNSPPLPVPSSVPLPPASAPLSVIVDDLKRRAGAGEAAAGCRLAAEYTYCAQLPYRRSEFDRWLESRQQSLERITEETSRQGVAAMIAREMPVWERRLQELEDHCRGVEIPGAPQIARTWRAAALAGDAVALKQYASGNAFRWGSLLDSLPELGTYRAEAERLATVAAQRGDMDMLLSLAAAYVPEPQQRASLLEQSISPDGARALALYRHIERALVRNGGENTQVAIQVRQRMANLSAGLSPQQLAQADALAQTMARDWEAPTVRGMNLLNASGNQRDVDRSWRGR